MTVESAGIPLRVMLLTAGSALAACEANS